MKSPKEKLFDKFKAKIITFTPAEINTLNTLLNMNGDGVYYAHPCLADLREKMKQL